MNAAAASKEVLWSAEEAVQATGGRTTCDWQATGVSIDSRSIAAGDLFVALNGLLLSAFLVIMANLAADLVLAWNDPRIRYS